MIYIFFKRKTFIVFIILFLLINSCGVKRASIGADNELVVIASLKDRKSTEVILQYIFDDTVFTPQPEPVYKIKFIEPKNFEDLKQQTSLIVSSFGNDLKNSGTKLVRQLLGEKKFIDTISGNNQFIISKDQFAKNQLFMIVNSPNESSILESLNGKENWIKGLFEEKYNSRQKSFLFSDARQTELEQRLLGTYFWSIKIPWGWNIIKEVPDSNFIWLGKELPYQWISVQWEYLNNTLDSSTVNNMVYTFPKINYKNIQFNSYKFSLVQGINDTWFDWEASGIWESIQEAKGGPFKLFIKIDNLNKRIFLINFLIHYPGKNKSNYIRQMELIASTINFENIK
ncbi:MAG: hypothetical protein CMG69_05740 [Candidatus Marinimicrobia bacterium]|nr:hypothetical protein [Candidatus Neomarinimicrobiota bacterium]|tara:strand:- start:70849 stop:71874 length:1026 start_codon:yes stop_codon:yes gene_type:complete